MNQKIEKFVDFNLANYAQACLVKAIADITKREIKTNLLLHFIMNIPKSNDVFRSGCGICFLTFSFFDESTLVKL